MLRLTKHHGLGNDFLVALAADNPALADAQTLLENGQKLDGETVTRLKSLGVEIDLTRDLTEQLAEAARLAKTELDRIGQAAQAGATAVKFQLFTANTLFSRDRAPRQWETAKRYELPEWWVKELRQEADRRGVLQFLMPSYLECKNLESSSF
jgi:hypothetical protein